MISLLYEYIYVLAFASGIFAIFMKTANIEKYGFLLFLIQIVLALLITIVKNSSISGKLISIGILSTFAVFVFVFARYEINAGKEPGAFKLYILLLIAFIAFILGEFAAHLRVFNIVTSALSFASLIPITILKFDIGKLFVASIFFMLIVMLAREIQFRWVKSGVTEIKTHMVYIAPFILLTAFMVFVMPASKEPYKWPIVRYVCRVVNETVQDIRIRASINKKEDYAETLVGFTEEGKITGKVNRNNSDRTLSVIGMPQEMQTLKLGGKNFSTFTGREWIEEDNTTDPDAMFDTIGITAAVNEYTDEPGTLIRSEDLYIKYLSINTNYVFAPSKTNIRKSNLPIPTYNILFDGSDMLWPETQSYKTGYWLSYVLVNTDSEEFETFISGTKVPSKESYEQSLDDLNLNHEKMYSYDNYISHQKNIKEIYGKEVKLSPELRAYMDELYEGCETDYDKLLRIRELLKTFEYTTSPGAIPDDIDSESEFLDYFILEKRSGYCNYYATAFTLLARAEGMSARYVQGYSTHTGSRYSMYIVSSMAHAWSEVYFDGAGWIAFDATPGYDGSSSWEGNYTAPIYTASWKSEDKNESNPLPELPDKEEEVNSLRWYVYVIPPVSGLAIISLLFVLFRLILKIRFNNFSDKKKFVIESKRILAILKLMGYSRESGETINEYKVRLSKKYYPEKLEFLEDLERYLYGKDKKEFKEEFEKAGAARKEFLHDLKKKSIIKYVYYLMTNGGNLYFQNEHIKTL